MQSHIGYSYTDSDVKDYLWGTLKSGQVVPGYGHAVLRKPDPRFKALIDFASKRPEIAQDALFQLVKKNSEIAPNVLKEHGKVSRRRSCSSSPSFSLPQSISLPYHNKLMLVHHVDQEPLPQRRLLFRRPLPSLWLPRDPLLHRHLWRQPWSRAPCAIDLGSRIRPTNRAPEEH